MCNQHPITMRKDHDSFLEGPKKHLPNMEEMQDLWPSTTPVSEVSKPDATCESASLLSSPVTILSIGIPLPGLAVNKGPDLDFGSGNWRSFQIRPDEPCLRNETEDLCNVLVIKWARFLHSFSLLFLGVIERWTTERRFPVVGLFWLAFWFCGDTYFLEVNSDNERLIAKSSK